VAHLASNNPEQIFCFGMPLTRPRCVRPRPLGERRRSQRAVRGHWELTILPANIRVERKYQMPAKSFPRHADITHNADEPAAGHKDA